MKIKHVEELVGITRKNIRFYEEQGLLSPRRAENGYREYHQEEILRLKQIKLLRKLAVSIEEIKLVLSGEKSLEDCLTSHLTMLEKERNNLEKMELISRRLIDSGEPLETLDVDTCLENMQRMEREGIRFMNISKMDLHRKKKTGALIGAGAMIFLMGVIIALMIWGNTQEPIPLLLLLFLIAIPAVIIIGVIAALVGRMKEIEGGEEDEASKY